MSTRGTRPLGPFVTPESGCPLSRLARGLLSSAPGVRCWLCGQRLRTYEPRRFRSPKWLRSGGPKVQADQLLRSEIRTRLNSLAYSTGRAALGVRDGAPSTDQIHCQKVRHNQCQGIGQACRRFRPYSRTRKKIPKPLLTDSNRSPRQLKSMFRGTDQINPPALRPEPPGELRGSRDGSRHPAAPTNLSIISRESALFVAMKRWPAPSATSGPGG